MINTILFDLDGTLLQMTQDDFLNAYLTKLGKVFTGFGLDAQEAIGALWAGTKAMAQNDGTVYNSQRFWDTFSQCLGLNDAKRCEIEAACDSFYSGAFNEVKSVMKPTDISKRTVLAMREKGYTVVLATNPVFPFPAVVSRLAWIGLETSDFDYITYYTNSTYCKPNPGYYKEIFSKIGKTPVECLMVGNSPTEDMCIQELGACVFLVTGYLEGEAGVDITSLKSGSLEELEEYLISLPNA
ncbi:MAG: HAD family hydrolase [Oscillospiraceae bacterium]|nr:HAD family hydrolase [Oscillospiraceae bacterium]